MSSSSGRWWTVAVFGLAGSAVPAGFVAAVVPTAQHVLAVLYWSAFGALALAALSWVGWQTVAERRLDREIDAGNAKTLRRLALDRPADEMARTR